MTGVEQRNKIGGFQIETGEHCDNLGIALCTYFQAHHNRPIYDPETERGWGEWVEDMTNKALDMIAEQFAALEEERLTP